MAPSHSYVSKSCLHLSASGPASLPVLLRYFDSTREYGLLQLCASGRMRGELSNLLLKRCSDWFQAPSHYAIGATRPFSVSVLHMSPSFVPLVCVVMGLSRLSTKKVDSMPLLEASDFDFDIDRYLNRFVPRNRVHVLPRFISHFLGFRLKPYQEPGNVLIAWWSFIGAFVGISIVAWIFRVPVIASHGVPTIVASSVRICRASNPRKTLADFFRALQRFWSIT